MDEDVQLVRQKGRALEEGRLTHRVTVKNRLEKGRKCRFKCQCICKCCFRFIPPLESHEFINMPFPHTRMFPLESPVMVFPFSAKVTHSTNLGFSCFCREHNKRASPSVMWTAFQRELAAPAQLVLIKLKPTNQHLSCYGIDLEVEAAWRCLTSNSPCFFTSTLFSRLQKYR